MTRQHPPAADPLVAAASRFLDVLMPILKEKCPEEDDQPLEIPGLRRWIPDLDMGHGMRQYKAVPMLFTAEQQCASRLLSELRQAGTDALAVLDSALVADPVVGPRIAGESVVSFGAGGGAFQGPGLIQQLVDVALSEADGFCIDVTAREALVKRWVEALRRSSDRVTVVIALREFDTACGLPIALEPDLVIDELSEAEVAVAVGFGGGLKSLSVDERVVSRTFAIKTSFESRLFVGDVPLAEYPREQAAREEAEARADLLLRALRVFKPGRVSASATFQYTARFGAEIAPVQGRVGPGFGWHAAEPYVLVDDELTRFREFWLTFKKAHVRPVISSALRRFNFAADRISADDKVVDLMIAAESLFLSEMDKRGGEFRFRLSARVASLLGTTLDERLQYFRFMRRAYDARSVIVHGGTLAERDLGDLNGELVRLELFADELEGVMRRALSVAITMVVDGQGFPPDWEHLMFAGPRT